jgi:hypothetical protein
MHPRTSLPFALLPLLAAPAWAQAPTWADDVACIIHTHCTPCHFDGGPGHFTLSTWEEAYMWRNDIAALTQSGLMPPWPPDPEYRSLAHERVLTQGEIDLIAAWVQAGAPEGDPASAPAPPVPPSGWAISDPDLTAVMPEFVVPPSTSDLYRCFVLEVDNPTDRHIIELEVVPGNREVVHHVLVFQDTSGQARVLDQNEPGPGYTSFGGIGVPSAKLVGVWVPGAEPFRTAPGMGIPLLADADLVIQVHYPAGSDAQLDSTRVNLRLSDAPQLRSLSIDPILDHLITITNGPLVIPPGQVRTFHAEFTSPIPATITAIGPHAHLVCTSMRAFAVVPGGDTIPLVDIPQWDFRWQDMYRFRQPIFLPAGTVLHGEATYDNTSANPNNPNDPPQWVFLGEATTDEMMLFYFAWTFGTPSDNTIVVDTLPPGAAVAACWEGITGLSTLGAGHATLALWPVPATDLLQVEAPAAGELLLIDHTGRVVMQRRVVRGSQPLDVAGLARGMYVVHWRSAAGCLAARQKLLLQ